MSGFTDEDLSAYLDDEAAPDTRLAIEHALASDAALGARLVRLQANDRELRRAFDAMTPPATPRAIHALLAARGASGGRRPLAAIPRRVARWALPIAAGLFVGFAVGRLPSAEQGELLLMRPGGAVAGPGLARALSTARSGVATGAGAGQALIALSFRSRDGRPCRQFDFRLARSAAAGVACREGDVWRMEAWASAPPTDPNGFTLASGPEDPAIAAALAKLGVRETLDRAAESAAIAAGWSSPPPRPASGGAR